MKKPRKLRAIDDNTIYDAPAKTIRLARKMQRKELGRIHDVLIAVRRTDNEGKLRVATYSYGSGTTGDLILMVKALESDFLT